MMYVSRVAPIIAQEMQCTNLLLLLQAKNEQTKKKKKKTSFL